MNCEIAINLNGVVVEVVTHPERITFEKGEQFEAEMANKQKVIVDDKVITTAENRRQWIFSNTSVQTRNAYVAFRVKIWLSRGTFANSINTRNYLSFNFKRVFQQQNVERLLSRQVAHWYNQVTRR